MSNDMNAKDLIQGKSLTETEGEGFFGGTPPGSTAGQPRPMMGRPGPRANSLHRMAGRPGEMGMGGEEGPPGFFNPKETSQLKDIVIFMLASLMRSQADLSIAQALMAGKELEPNQLQHVLDEASRLKLPESHTPILQKIYKKLSP